LALGGTKRGGDVSDLSDREVRLTAVVYAHLGVVPHLKAIGCLPETIGGPWNCIPMRLVIG
jgi:hypothetical protein